MSLKMLTWQGIYMACYLQPEFVLCMSNKLTVILIKKKNRALIIACKIASSKETKQLVPHILIYYWNMLYVLDDTSPKKLTSPKVLFTSQFEPVLFFLDPSFNRTTKFTNDLHFRFYFQVWIVSSDSS